MDRPFIKGLTLSELLYEEAVRPILAAHFPGLAYSAAVLGTGSEVLGFDDPQSMDHNWGPRLMLFLGEADHAAYGEQIDRVLRRELPREIHGYPTNLARDEGGTRWMVAADGDEVDHGIRLFAAHSYYRQALGFDPTRPIGAVDWLSASEYRLLMFTSGRVFHDGLGELEAIRARLRYYPHDVWLYLLAGQWRRVGQEEAFVGRCGQVGDDLGSRLVAARLVRDLMRLCFLMERRYAPYIKWLGSAFARLDCARDLIPVFTRALQAGSWPEREEHLTAAYERVAAMHNRLAITAPLPAQVRQFHDRPFRVIEADRFVGALRGAIASDEVRALPEHLGSVDQFLDSTDALAYLERFRAVYGS